MSNSVLTLPKKRDRLQRLSNDFSELTKRDVTTRFEHQQETDVAPANAGIATGEHAVFLLRTDPKLQPFVEDLTNWLSEVLIDCRLERTLSKSIWASTPLGELQFSKNWSPMIGLRERIARAFARNWWQNRLSEAERQEFASHCEFALDPHHQWAEDIIAFTLDLSRITANGSQAAQIASAERHSIVMTFLSGMGIVL